MARIQEWVDLTGETVRSVGSREVSGLYDRDWPEVRRRLLEDHQAAIDAQPGRIRKWLRTASALLFGLTRRLSPERRILFFIAFVIGTLSLVHLGSGASDQEYTFRGVLSVGISLVIMTFLLALEVIDKLRFRDELELARELQESLIPRAMPEVEGLSIFGFNRIANTVGGDLYDFSRLPDGRLAILFGDASGHGMTAGLVMAVAQAAFRTQLEISSDPESMVGSLNRLLCRTGGSRSFFTACYVRLDPEGPWEGIVAGHPEILVVTPAGISDRIGSGSYPLGIRPSLSWDVVRGTLPRGSTLLFCSDGIPESMNASGEVYGYERLEQSVARHAGAADLAQRVLADWQAFMGDEAPEDDVSFVTVRRD